MTQKNLRSIGTVTTTGILIFPDLTAFRGRSGHVLELHALFFSLSALSVLPDPSFPGEGAGPPDYLYTRPSKQSLFAVWSRLSIKRLRECNTRVLADGAKTITSHRVETERNVNFLLAATVNEWLCRKWLEIQH